MAVKFSNLPRLEQSIPVPPGVFNPLRVRSLAALTYCAGEVAKEVGIDDEEYIAFWRLAPSLKDLASVVSLLRRTGEVRISFGFTKQRFCPSNGEYMVVLTRCILYGSKTVVAFFLLLGAVGHLDTTDKGEKRFAMKVASVELSRLTYVDGEEVTQAWLVEQQKQIIFQKRAVHQGPTLLIVGDEVVEI